MNEAYRGRIVVFAALLGAFAMAGVAEAKTQILWSSVDSDFARQRLVIAQPDGSHRHDLTDPKPKNTLDGDGQFSPDGSQVVFERDLRGGKDAQVVIIGADGANERVVDLGCVDPCADDVAPTWSLGGDRINFTRVVGPFDAPNDSARSAVLWSAFPDGTGIQRVSEPGIDGVYEDYFARYSPDGSYIVFTRVRNKRFHSAVFRMDVDGTDVRQLTPWKLDADLANLSPATSGSTKGLVVFETYGHDETRPPGKRSNVATVPSTCASLSKCRKRIRFLTNHKGGAAMAFNPTWSPNGKRIAYTKFSDENDNHPCCIGDIYTMRPDGSHRKPVSTSPKFEYRPDWGSRPSPPR
jgi:Tol biopolymer transport system component